MNKKPLKLKITTTLDQKEQDKRAVVAESLLKQGMPEQIVDGIIYRIGLDSAFTEIQKQQTQNEHKPTNT